MKVEKNKSQNLKHMKIENEESNISSENFSEKNSISSENKTEVSNNISKQNSEKSSENKITDEKFQLNE